MDTGDSTVEKSRQSGNDGMVPAGTCSGAIENLTSTEGRGGATSELKVSIKRVLSLYTAGLSIAQDSLDVAWKFAPVCLFFPAMLLWSYLRKIGWEPLFAESVVSISGFVVMIVAAVVLLLAVFLQFFLPSLFSGPAAAIHEEIHRGTDLDLPIRKSMRRAVRVLYLMVPLVWITTLNVTVIALELPPGISVVAGILITYVVAAGYVTLRRDIFLRQQEKEAPASRCHALDMSRSRILSVCWWGSRLLRKSFKYWGPTLALAFLPTLTAISLFLPMLMGLELFDGSITGKWASFAVFEVVGVGSMVGMAPGLAYLLAKVAGESTMRASKLTMIVCTLVGYAVLMGVVYFAPVTTFILRSTGAIEDKPRIYQILKPDLVAALRAVRIKVTPSSAKMDGQPQAYFAYAYTRFSFNNVLLMCKDWFPFSLADSAAWTNGGERKRAALWATAGNLCVKVRADEIRPIQRTSLR
ncbi:hypothetical protein [Burkholderia sp. AU18528]|uniref:hypothetical protein n=1 Tax=Burkholderia sp. AU18528 TaxID=2015350 RepID=UPI00117D140F|nr:hypothetical protein [Burkholderia sp. AU18528]